MAKKPKPTERKYSEPDLAFRAGYTLHRIYALKAHEWMDSRTSTKYVHAITGPALVHEDLSPSMRRVWDGDPDDATFWGWIGRLISTPTEGLQLLTRTDEEIHRRIERKPIRAEDVFHDKVTT